MLRFPAPVDGVPWPTDDWPTGAPGDGIDGERLHALLDRAFTDPEPDDLTETRALLVVHRGVLVAERYNPRTDAATPLRSWSMAKSVLATLVGVLVDEGRLDPSAPASVPEWASPGDPRGDITLDHLLQMRSGLAWREDYVDGERSDVIEMLFGSGQDDVAAFAASVPPAHPPGAVTLYSSGVSNIVSRLVGRVVGGGALGLEAWARAVLFDRIGIRSASPRFDAAGTWIASSYLWMTARDWARFGLLQLRGGQWDGQRVVSEAWVRHQATASGVDEDGDVHGAHWWVLPHPPGTFVAAGHDAQYLRVVPARDLVVVRLGRTPADRSPLVKAWLDEIVDCVDDVGGAGT